MSLAASMTAQMLVAVVYKQKRIVGKINNRFKWPNGIPFIQEFLWMMFVRVTFSDSSFILKRSARDIYYTPYNSNNVLQKCYVFRVIFLPFSYCFYSCKARILCTTNNSWRLSLSLMPFLCAHLFIISGFICCSLLSLFNFFFRL